MTPRFIVYILLLFSCSIYGLLNWKKFNSLNAKNLTLLLTITFISEIISRVLFFLEGMTYPVYHFLIPIQLVFFYVLSRTQHSIKAPYLNIFTILSLSSLLLMSIQTGWSAFPSKQLAILGLYAISSALFYYLKALKKPTTELIWDQPMFWFFTGNLVFYSFTFFDFGFYASLKSIDIEIPDWLKKIIFFANLILYPCYFMCLYKTPKTTTS